MSNLLDEFWLDDSDLPDGWADWASQDEFDESSDADDYSAERLAELIDDSDDFLEELLNG